MIVKEMTIAFQLPVVVGKIHSQQPGDSMGPLSNKCPAALQRSLSLSLQQLWHNCRPWHLLLLALYSRDPTAWTSVSHSLTQSGLGITISKGQSFGPLNLIRNFCWVLNEILFASWIQIPLPSCLSICKEKHSITPNRLFLIKGASKLQLYHYFHYVCQQKIGDSSNTVSSVSGYLS